VGFIAAEWVAAPGTGAAADLAESQGECGDLTVGIVTEAFRLRGAASCSEPRGEQALAPRAVFFWAPEHVDTLIVIPMTGCVMRSRSPRRSVSAPPETCASGWWRASVTCHHTNPAWSTLTFADVRSGDDDGRQTALLGHWAWVPVPLPCPPEAARSAMSSRCWESSHDRWGQGAA